MKLLFALLLGGGLMLGNAEAPVENEIPQVEESVEASENQAVEGSNEAVEPSASEEAVETPSTSEEVVDPVPTPEQSEFQKLLEMWLNGELVLDDETMSKLEQEIWEKIQADEGFNSLKENITKYINEKVEVLLQNVIGDEKERQKVASVLTAVLSAISSLGVMFIFTKGIRKENKRASINNETISKSSQTINQAVVDSKESIAKMEELLKSDKDSSEKLAELVKQNAENTERWSKSIMGVLQIIYDKEGEVNEEQSKEQTLEK